MLRKGRTNPVKILQISSYNCKCPPRISSPSPARTPGWWWCRGLPWTTSRGRDRWETWNFNDRFFWWSMWKINAGQLQRGCPRAAAAPPAHGPGGELLVQQRQQDAVWGTSLRGGASLLVHRRQGEYLLELQAKVNTKVRNHGEDSYLGLHPVESAYMSLHN